MSYLTEIQKMQSSVNHADITRKLKACAGAIISNTLTIEHVPSGARDLMSNRLIHDFVRIAFRDVVVDCLAIYFDDLEDRRKEVLDDLVRKTRSEYGMRLRLLQSAIERTQYGLQYGYALDDLERHITPEMYGAFVAVVRQEYARQ